MNNVIRNHKTIIKNLLICVIYVLTISTASATVSLWPEFGYDNGNTGQSPYASSSDGTLKWSLEFKPGGGVGTIYSAPIIDENGTIYFTSDTNILYSISSNGSLNWQYTFGEWNNVFNSPAIDSNGTIYVGTDNDTTGYYLQAINPNGTLKWGFIANNWVGSSPTIDSDGIIYFTDYDSNLYALYSDGTQKWMFSDSVASTSYSSPAISTDGNTIYYTVFKNNGVPNNKLYAVYADNGTEKWSFAKTSYFETSPSVGSDDVIYVGNNNDHFYAVYPNGTEKWDYNTLTNNIEGGSAISPDGVVYFLDITTNLYAVYTNGTEKWKIDIDGSYGTPIIDSSGVIYVGSNNGDFYAVNPNGSIRWNYTTGNRIESPASISSDGTVYIGSDDGKLYAFDSQASSCLQTVSTSIFEDDFTDGDYTNNPIWTDYYSCGTFTITDQKLYPMLASFGCLLYTDTSYSSGDIVTLQFNYSGNWDYNHDYIDFYVGDIPDMLDFFELQIGRLIDNTVRIQISSTNIYKNSSFLNDTNEHNFMLVFDQTEYRVDLYIDGEYIGNKTEISAWNLSRVGFFSYQEDISYFDNFILSTSSATNTCCQQVGDATVCGTCYNAKTNATLSAVDVSFFQSLTWYNTTSDTNGSYGISDLSLNTNISVDASKSGYWFNPFTISLPSSGTYILDLYLVPECPGVVCGLDARPSYTNNTTFYYGANANPSYTLLNNSLVTLYNGTYSANNNTNINGYFEIPVYADGAYSLTGLLGDYVTRKPEPITVSGLTSLDFLLSVCPGDINLDTAVNVNDFVLFAAFYNLPSTSPYYYYLADLNDDDYINNKDFVIYATKHKSICTET